MSTHNLCFEQKYEKYQNFYRKISFFLVVKFSVNLNRRVFVMRFVFFFFFFTLRPIFYYHCLLNNYK